MAMLAKSEDESKSVYEIAETATIVYSNEFIDTLITINSSGLQWWFKNGEKYSLADQLDAHFDLKNYNIADARKLGEDWFFTLFDQNLNSSPEEKPIVSVQIEPSTKIVPSFIDQHKKDAHTEHCCADHKVCVYKNPKCTVVSGYKKPSYSCKCI